jgi:hypothetical protein
LFIDLRDRLAGNFFPPCESGVFNIQFIVQGAFVIV